MVDATQLLRISVDATGDGRELLERLATAHEEPAPAPHVHGEGARPPRHRGEGAHRDPPAAIAEAEATGAGAPEGERIREVDVSGRPHAADGEEEAPGGGRRRRRRRGGRRRRRRGPGAGAPEGGAPQHR
jgi:hypothetical protein